MHFSKLLQERKSAKAMRPVSIESTLLLFSLIQNFLNLTYNLNILSVHFFPIIFNDSGRLLHDFLTASFFLS